MKRTQLKRTQRLLQPISTVAPRLAMTGFLWLGLLALLPTLARAEFILVENRGAGGSITFRPPYTFETAEQEESVSLFSSVEFSGPPQHPVFQSDYLSTKLISTTTITVFHHEQRYRDDIFPGIESPGQYDSDLVGSQTLGVTVASAAFLDVADDFPVANAETIVVLRQGGVNQYALRSPIKETIEVTFADPGSFIADFDVGYQVNAFLGDDSLQAGFYRYSIDEQLALYKFAGESLSDLQKGIEWFDNMTDSNSETLLQKVRRYLRENSRNANPSRKSINVGTGVLGSIDTSGTSVHTASPGMLTYEMMLPDSDLLSLPIVFEENFEEATMEVFFEDELLGSFLGSDFVANQLAYLDLDISSFRNSTGALSLVLNTTGDESAVVYIPESIELSPEAIPEPATILMVCCVLGLGVARRIRP